MSTTTIDSDKISGKGLLKKGLESLVYVIIASVILGAINLIPFYWHTNDSLPIMQEDIKSVKEDIQKIKSASEGPLIDGKLNSQRLDDIQRQVNDVKSDVKEVKDGQEKIYDLLLTQNKK